MGIVSFYLWLQLLAHLPYVPATDRMAPMQRESLRYAAKPGCVVFHAYQPGLHYRDMAISVNGVRLPRCK